MPTETFFNLPDKKRNRVLDSALTEFADRSFSQATVSRIVKRAGIPKGSFYQYFQSKRDLYKYTVRMSQEKKITYMKKILDKQDDCGFFSKLRSLYLTGFRFAQDNPRLLAIGQNLLKEDEEIRREVFKETLPQAEDLIIDMLEEGVERGEIDPQVNLKVACTIISSFSMRITDLFLESPSSFEKNIDLYMTEVDDMLHILKNGLKNNGG